jgi:hypothetical protein
MTANVLPKKASATANSPASIFQYLRTSNATLQPTLSRHLELRAPPIPARIAAAAEAMCPNGDNLKDS